MFYRKILQELKKWKISTSRKPLIIRGARQVGKTTVVNEFGKLFKQYIYLNLERKQDLELFDTSNDVHQITERIFIEKGKQFSLLEDTLLFIDELQEAPHVVNLLRYYKEEMPQLAVIAAGSMLETLLGKNITFPVGRVEYKVLRPVSFEEFLIASEREDLIQELSTIPMRTVAHETCLRLFHTYALLGGMPEIIQHYLKHKDITALGEIYDALIRSYLDDAEKYAKSPKQLQLIRFSIQQAVIHAGKRVSFQRFGNSNYSSTEISEVLNALQKTHLLHVIYPTTGFGLPIEEDRKKTPRLQFLDSGLINYSVGLQKELIGTTDLNTIYQGKLIEHLVGQELLASQTLTLKGLSFWIREKSQSSAELDFVYSFEGKVVPIEVKSGATGTLKSLQLYLDEAPINYAIRFYAGKVILDKHKTQKGKTFYLLSLPYYLVAQLEKYIQWLKEQIITSEGDQTFIVKDEGVPYKPTKTGKKELSISIDKLTDKHLSILWYCRDTPKKGKEILEDCLKVTNQSRNNKVYLKPLIDLGLLEFTDLTYLKSKEQRYRLTDKGKTTIT
jgi:predicted AAA+ superfamily ATPase